ncbi:MAG: glycosyltransferase [Proteobacteria bacterium]|nr:glycosyltransferase [Pseudomonadota bacterium]
MLLTATALSALLWLTVLVLPWRPWSTAERLRIPHDLGEIDLGDVTVLIPARDEASCIAATLRALAAQGNIARIVLVDDQSSDGTGAVARGVGLDNLVVLDGTPLPVGWSGKLWALEQASARAETPYTLLLDADIELGPRVLAALKQHMQRHDLTLASVMASLHMGNAFEKLLLPPFIYFFKLIYPFALSNRPRSPIAAAAGGCVLLRTESLRAIGGFASLREAIIDDCTLAQRIKRNGGRTWLGLSRDVRAIRPYETLANIWNMVARTAFTQLRYSNVLLVICTLMLGLSFIAPLIGLVSGNAPATGAALVALAAMSWSYRPTIKFYDLNPLWVATLSVAACLFLAMTWTSAWRYWTGERSRWKSRSYDKIEGH